MTGVAEELTISIDDTHRVSGLLFVPRTARACFVLAHGAGAGMTHPFLKSVAEDLADCGIASLRYQFPYMEQGSKRPDPPMIAHATVRAAVLEATRRFPNTPLFAGGKSFGGRMTSQTQAASPIPEVRGLAFLGFPLHPAGRPSEDRAAHLFDVHIPMLFLQGTRDAMADVTLLQPLIERLGVGITLKLFEAADHSFQVPARSGRKPGEVRAEMVGTLAAWMDDVL